MYRSHKFYLSFISFNSSITDFTIYLPRCDFEQDMLLKHLVNVNYIILSLVFIHKIGIIRNDIHEKISRCRVAERCAISK